MKIPHPVQRARAATAPGASGWRGRAALVLAGSLLLHAVVITVGNRALHLPAPEFGEGALIEARLLAPSAVIESAPNLAPRPAPKSSLPAPRAVAPEPAAPAAPVVEDRPRPPALPEPVAETPPLSAEPESSTPASAAPAAPQAIVDTEFNASGDDLLNELNDAKAPRAALPVSARYVYQTTDSQYVALSGTTTLRWRFDEDGTYAAQLITTVFGISVLELNSQGKVSRFGLSPERYTEKALRRSEVAANFDWNGQRVTFSARSHERELRRGAQDRLSFQFQLMALGQRMPHRFRPGAAISFPVGGRDDVAVYRLVVIGTETVQSGVGDLNAVKLERPKGGADGADSRIEVWLAPEMAWLPVKLRFTDRRDRVTENVLSEYSIPAE